MTTIIIPVSRPDYLDAVFHCLEVLECNKDQTNLLAVVDGGPDLFVNVRNRVETSKFNQRLTVQFESKQKLRNYDVLGRRQRISDIHNTFVKYLNGDFKADYVFGVEDDTIFPSNSLKKLIKDYSCYPYAGFIQGVQVGRWGIPYVGAWTVDDVYEPTEITSLMPPRTTMNATTDIGLVTDDSGEVQYGHAVNLQGVHAGGFYCFLTRFETYFNHEFKPFDRTGMGPDFEYGLSLRREGLLNYTDWSLLTTHRTPNKDLTLLNTEVRQVKIKKVNGVWRQTNGKARLH